MVKSQELYLFAKQSSPSYGFNDATAAGAGLTAADIIEPMKDSTAEWDPQMEQIETVAGGFEQDAAVPGDEPFNATLRFPMTPGLPSGTLAGRTMPYWMKVADAMCGYSVGASTTAGPSRFAMIPVNNFTTAGLLRHFTGDMAASGAIATGGYNLAADWKCTVEAGKVPMIEYTATGGTYSIADATQPSVTKARVAPRAFKSATVTFLASSSYKLIKMDFSGNQAPQNLVDPSQASGRGASEITDRKVRFTAQFYTLKLATVDPITALRNSTQGTLVLQWGSTTEIVKISATYAQITKCVKSDANGVTVWDIEGQCNRNDLKFDVYPA